MSELKFNAGRDDGDVALVTGGFSCTSQKWDHFKKIISSNIIAKIAMPAADLRLESAQSVLLGGERLTITQEAFKDLCRVAGLSNRVYENLGTIVGGQTVIELANALTSMRSTKLGVIVNTESAKIIGFSSNCSQVIPGPSLIQAVETMCNRNNIQVNRASINGRGDISIIGTAPKWDFDVPFLPEEAHTGGISISTTDKGATVTSFVNRKICTNGMVAPTFLEDFGCNKMNRAAAFLRALGQFTGFNWESYQKQVGVLSNTRASLFEFHHAYSLVKNILPKGEDSKELLETSFNITNVKFDLKSHTHLDKPFQEIPENVLKKMNSPMNSWDLLNVVTNIGSHNQMLQEEERFRLLTSAGRMFRVTPDLVSPYGQIYN